MCMHFSVGSQKACNGRFRKVPAADDVGTLETFPVYYAGERGGPKRRGGKHFVVTFTSFKCLRLGEKCRGEASRRQGPL